MIRKAVKSDIQALKEIYNHAILHTIATFDTEIKDDENRLQWFFEHEKEPYVIFVEEQEGQVCGYASLSQYRDRKAFDHTVEISIYIKEEYRRKGIGKRLMKHTLDFAKQHSDIWVVISLITGENKTSIHLHEYFGFTFCGQLKKVGYKFDKWLDLNAYQIVYKE
ncbi:MAG: N-acetyltransferase [Lachnospiraceae bacterium]|nr:N-acetyltransferase [Lachnospiraceae bacterium]